MPETLVCRVSPLVAVSTLVGALGAGASCGSQEPSEGVSATSAQVAGYNWLQYGGDARHASNNTLEKQISAQSVSRLTRRFQVSFPGGGSRTAPVVVTAVSTSSGVRDLLLLTTTGGMILALDAHTGASVWSHSHGGNGGTWASAAVDPALAYVYTYGLDGAVHKHNVGDGSEVTGNGWPELVTRKTGVEEGSGALTIASAAGGTFLYAITSGYPGDAGDYQGHVTAINLSTGAQRVFNALCSSQTTHYPEGTPTCGARQAGIWAREGALYDSDTGKLYVVTGNGPFDGSQNWGDSVLALNADGTGAAGGPLDSYTPSNQAQLASGDADLGSAGPLLLPGTSKFPHLAVHVGKDRTVRIFNLDNLSGQGRTGREGGEVSSSPLPQGGEVQNAGAVWTNPADGATWAFFASPTNGIAGMKVSVDASGNPSIHGVWTHGGAVGSPLVANNVLYYVTSGTVHAVDPTSGNSLWTGATAGGVHWQSPVVANGILYVVDDASHITAFGLPAVVDAGADAPVAHVRIDTGGPAVSPFAADESFTGGTTIDHANPIDVSGVANPAPAAVYQSARIGNFTYAVPGFAAGSSHVVRLHFAETFWTAAGKRVFDVQIDGAPALTKFDIFQATGARNKAIVKEFTETAPSTGTYTIQFVSVVNESLISGIEIE